MPADYTYTILEFDSSRDFPTTGSVDTIYIDTERNLPFRWNGEYIQVSTTDAEIWGILGTALVTKIPYTGATQNVDLGEHELKAGQVEFDQTPTGTAGVATLRWNDADGTLDLGLKGGNVTLQLGQEQVTRVVNKTGSNLLEANYQAVRISGAQGNRLKVDLAQANNDANSADTIGIVTETINNNQEGFVTTSGLVRNIDTTGSLQSETWSDGDVLYLSGTTAGRITNVKPAAPIHTVIMGYVVRAHATQGQIFVKVDNGYELDELHNVAITSPTNGQVLVYDSSTSLWKNGAGGGGGSTTWGSITGTLSSQTDLQTALDAKQDDLTLTTTGTSGAATLVGSTLNIPQYSGGGFGIHALVPLASGAKTSAFLTSVANVNAGGFVSNRMVAYPFIPAQSFTTSDLYVSVTSGVTGSLCRIAIYSDLNGIPNTRLFLSADLDCSTIGIKTALTSFNFVAGTTYWLTFHGNAQLATMGNMGIGTTYNFQAVSTGVATNVNCVFRTFLFTTGTPTPFGAVTYSCLNLPFIGITKA